MVPTALRYIKQMPIGSRGYYWRVHKKMDSIFCRALSEKKTDFTFWALTLKRINHGKILLLYFWEVVLNFKKALLVSCDDRFIYSKPALTAVVKWLLSIKFIWKTSNNNRSRNLNVPNKGVFTGDINRKGDLESLLINAIVRATFSTIYLALKNRLRVRPF